MLAVELEGLVTRVNHLEKQLEDMQLHGELSMLRALEELRSDTNTLLMKGTKASRRLLNL